MNIVETYAIPHKNTSMSGIEFERHANIILNKIKELGAVKLLPNKLVRLGVGNQIIGSISQVIHEGVYIQVCCYEEWLDNINDDSIKIVELSVEYEPI